MFEVLSWLLVKGEQRTDQIQRKISLCSSKLSNLLNKQPKENDDKYNFFHLLTKQKDALNISCETSFISFQFKNKNDLFNIDN